MPQKLPLSYEDLIHFLPVTFATSAVVPSLRIGFKQRDERSAAIRHNCFGLSLILARHEQYINWTLEGVDCDDFQYGKSLLINAPSFPGLPENRKKGCPYGTGKFTIALLYQAETIEYQNLIENIFPPSNI